MKPASSGGRCVSSPWSSARCWRSPTPRAESLRYAADPGEVNDVVLSPGRFFSIQDAADVAQVGLGGCVASNFLAGLSWSIGAEAGTSVGTGFEVEVGVGSRFRRPADGNQPARGNDLPQPCRISPRPGNVSDSLQQAFGNITKGVASAVAGAAVTQSGSVYLDVSASNGTVDEYRLYQSIVASHLGDPRNRTEQQVRPGQHDHHEHAGRRRFLGRRRRRRLLQVHRAAGRADRRGPGQQRLGRRPVCQHAADPLRLHRERNFPATSASATAAPSGRSMCRPFRMPGPYYVSVADNGFGDGKPLPLRGDRKHQRRSTRTCPSRSRSTAATLNTPIPDLSTVESTLPVSIDDAFARATSMSVTLNIQHTYDGDLSAYLVSPSGTTVELFSHVGGSGDNFTEHDLRRLGRARRSASGTAPFTGTFQPEGHLCRFRERPDQRQLEAPRRGQRGRRLGHARELVADVQRGQQRHPGQRRSAGA